jgi:hypothetical protein
MPEPDDMEPDSDKPVTRRGLERALERALERYATKEDLERALERYATKEDLERLAIATKEGFERCATRQDLERFEQRFERLEQRFERFEERLLAELARHSLATKESISADIAIVDEQYRDLPARVTRLEEAVFRPPRKRARRS